MERQSPKHPSISGNLPRVSALLLRQGSRNAIVLDVLVERQIQVIHGFLSEDPAKLALVFVLGIPHNIVLNSPRTDAAFKPASDLVCDLRYEILYPKHFLHHCAHAVHVLLGDLHEY